MGACFRQDRSGCSGKAGALFSNTAITCSCRAAIHGANPGRCGATDSVGLPCLSCGLSRAPAGRWRCRPIECGGAASDKEVIRGLLSRLCAESADAARSIDESVERANGDPDALDQLLERQNYRLSFWRTAARDLGYRRFFDVNSLVGLRMERRHVFDDTHRLVLQWIRAGDLDGLRVDHPDGLRDPEGYFGRLREAAPDTWIVAEKILELGERLRPSWNVAGQLATIFSISSRVYASTHRAKNI